MTMWASPTPEQFHDLELIPTAFLVEREIALRAHPCPARCADAAQEVSLARHPGWAAYKARAGLLLPRFRRPGRAA